MAAYSATTLDKKRSACCCTETTASTWKSPALPIPCGVDCYFVVWFLVDAGSGRRTDLFHRSAAFLEARSHLLSLLAPTTFCWFELVAWPITLRLRSASCKCRFAFKYTVFWFIFVISFNAQTLAIYLVYNVPFIMSASMLTKPIFYLRYKIYI